MNRYLSVLEQAVARRVTATDIQGFSKVITALEEEALQRSQANQGGRVDNKKPE